MVVLEASAPLAHAATGPQDQPDPMESLRCGYAQSSPSPMKMVSKRFINIHQWLGPVCAKQLKEAVVSGTPVPVTRYPLPVPPLPGLGWDKMGWGGEGRVASQKKQNPDSGATQPRKNIFLEHILRPI